jgi:hypothetical protein
MNIKKLLEVLPKIGIGLFGLLVAVRLLIAVLPQWFPTPQQQALSSLPGYHATLPPSNWLMKAQWFVIVPFIATLGLYLVLCFLEWVRNFGKS